jgi:metal-responsive CopG/Arc/MetJ family transcriptional regulator
MRKLVYLSVRVPAALNRLVERKAVKDGITKSEVIRIALMRYLVEEQANASTGEKSPDLQEKTATPGGTPPPRKGAA